MTETDADIMPVDDELVGGATQIDVDGSASSLGPAQTAVLKLQNQIDDITDQLQSLPSTGKANKKKAKGLLKLLKKLQKQQSKLAKKAKAEGAQKAKVLKQEAKADAKVGKAEANAAGKAAVAAQGDPFDELLAAQLGGAGLGGLDAAAQFDELSGAEFGVGTDELLPAVPSFGGGGGGSSRLVLAAGALIVVGGGALWWRKRRKSKRGKRRKAA